MQHVSVFRVPTSAPQDVAGLASLLDAGVFGADDVLAAIGKTEGNGGSNDFTKDFAVAAIQAELARRGADPAQPYCLMSGGCEGVMSPHVTYFVRSTAPTGLAIGVARSGRLPAEDLGRMAQVRSVAELVDRALHAAGTDTLAQVHLVSVKCPTPDTTRSAVLSRAASALGVALAIGEVAADGVSEATILGDFATYTRVGSVSSEIGTNCHEALVLCQVPAGQIYRAAHAALADAVDSDGARRVLAEAGVGNGYRLAALFAKCEPDPRGSVRGWRHTMFSDADIGAFRHIRAAVAGVLASVTGDPGIFVSGGAEHQGPLGGGTVVAIAERER
jgi:cyanuric acid amidohydrolase